MKRCIELNSSAKMCCVYATPRRLYWSYLFTHLFYRIRSYKTKLMFYSYVYSQCLAHCLAHCRCLNDCWIQLNIHIRAKSSQCKPDGLFSQSILKISLWIHKNPLMILFEKPEVSHHPAPMSPFADNVCTTNHRRLNKSSAVLQISTPIHFPLLNVNKGHVENLTLIQCEVRF